LAFNVHKNDQLPLHEIAGAKRIYILGAELSQDHPVVNHIVQNLRFKNQIPVTFITNNADSTALHKVDETIFANDYHDFVKAWQPTSESAVIVSEKTIDQQTFIELKEKTGFGIMLLRGACNAQSLYDMGMANNQEELLRKGLAKNIFIFGENPIATHPQVTDLIKAASFICVQSLFENETTAIANLALPMNFAIETGGSYTNTFKITQTFNAMKQCEFDWNDYQFYARLQEIVNCPLGHSYQ
jgi:predicted molibdopterin-dependent oxidoreductase YjgC